MYASEWRKVCYEQPEYHAARSLACYLLSPEIFDQRAEHPRVKAFWNHDAMTLAPFTEFFLKVYSPGDATHADLIIVYAGLYWLFMECMNATQDAGTKLNYQAQAFTCRDNLETVLSSLPFHLPSTIETTCAMFLAVCPQHAYHAHESSLSSKCNMC